jgi:SPP1 gp7 family putative phage head morphogenesis protein
MPSNRKVIELQPIKETTEDFDRLESRIKELFKRTIYYPLLAELKISKSTLKNDNDALLEALRSGRITFSRGQFTGRFDASISKELRKLGAKWDNGVFRIAKTSLPRSVKQAISTSEVRFVEKMAQLDKKLAQVVPEQVAEQLKSADLFDRTLWKTDKNLKASMKNISVAPELTVERRKRIAEEWQNNMQLWIKNFTEEQIVELRKKIQKNVFSGNRYHSVIQTIQKSYGVSANKAKFLARQETSLLMTKFKESRYTDAGVMEYKWGCVAGTAKHPVRPAHKILEGKVFRWDDPPITTSPGEPARRNNPGEDYNCRCFAKPIVRFSSK